VGFAGDAASTANSLDIEMNKQDAPARIETKSERPAHPSRQFFPFEKSPRGGSLSDVSTIEADLRFSGREDFWIIVAARSEDETEIRAGKAAGGRRDQGHSARDPSTLFS